MFSNQENYVKYKKKYRDYSKHSKNPAYFGSLT